MKRIGKVIRIDDSICLVQTQTTVGCCGGKRKSSNVPSCCEKDNIKNLTFKALNKGHNLKVNDNVIVEASNFTIFFQAFLLILLPSFLALILYSSLRELNYIVFSPFLLSIFILLMWKFIFPTTIMPYILDVNPHSFTPSSLKTCCSLKKEVR